MSKRSRDRDSVPSVNSDELGLSEEDKRKRKEQGAFYLDQGFVPPVRYDASPFPPTSAPPMPPAGAAPVPPAGPLPFDPDSPFHSIAGSLGGSARQPLSPLPGDVGANPLTSKEESTGEGIEEEYERVLGVDGDEPESPLPAEPSQLTPEALAELNSGSSLSSPIVRLRQPPLKVAIPSRGGSGHIVEIPGSRSSQAGSSESQYRVEPPSQPQAAPAAQPVGGSYRFVGVPLTRQQACSLPPIGMGSPQSEDSEEDEVADPEAVVRSVHGA